jgi:hypothetical protein
MKVRDLFSEGTTMVVPRGLQDSRPPMTIGVEVGGVIGHVLRKFWGGEGGLCMSNSPMRLICLYIQMHSVNENSNESKTQFDIDIH